MAQWAKARHIQVVDRDSCQYVVDQLVAGADFELLARQYSCCQTARYGGSLGWFGEGQMGGAIDEVVFGGEVGLFYGPVKSSHGFHVIQVTERKPR
ncbi:MAG: peptidylprolyl isomerase [Rhodopirellula sp.]|nr:peptidylprolyl isomerase [Rhodopirellula sp.]